MSRFKVFVRANLGGISITANCSDKCEQMQSHNVCIQSYKDLSMLLQNKSLIYKFEKIFKIIHTGNFSDCKFLIFEKEKIFILFIRKLRVTSYRHLTEQG